MFYVKLTVPNLKALYIPTLIQSSIFKSPAMKASISLIIGRTSLEFNHWQTQEFPISYQNVSTFPVHDVHCTAHQTRKQVISTMLSFGYGLVFATTAANLSWRRHPGRALPLETESPGCSRDGMKERGVFPWRRKFRYSKGRRILAYLRRMSAFDLNC